MCLELSFGNQGDAVLVLCNLGIGIVKPYKSRDRDLGQLS